MIVGTDEADNGEHIDEEDTMTSAYGLTSDIFDDMIRLEGGQTNNPPPNMSEEELLKVAVEGELDRYIAQVKGMWTIRFDKTSNKNVRDYDKSANPFIFWDSHKTEYPHLYLFAMKYVSHTM